MNLFAMFYMIYRLGTVEALEQRGNFPTIGTDNYWLPNGWTRSLCDQPKAGGHPCMRKRRGPTSKVGVLV